jgi:hypothetical protein
MKNKQQQHSRAAHGSLYLLNPPKPTNHQILLLTRAPRTFRHSFCPILKTFPPPEVRAPLLLSRELRLPIARLVALSRSIARRLVA